MEVERCWCDKPSPGGLTKEPCTRPVTQEDMLCDECRDGCSTVAIGPVGVEPKDMTVLSHHAQVDFDGPAPLRPTTTPTATKR